jgi:quercetin dioxygenase-like cupin family protein
VEVRRFGFGHRRPEGPAGSHGVTAALIHADSRGSVSEVAFARKAAIEPHSNPNTSWFAVIEGGGFVQVGEDVARVFAGEAVLWPAGVIHAASTDLSEMRALVIEFAADDDAVRGVLPGLPLALEQGSVARGEGALADDGTARGYDPAEGEPL